MKRVKAIAKRWSSIHLEQNAHPNEDDAVLYAIAKMSRVPK